MRNTIWTIIHFARPKSKTVPKKKKRGGNSGERVARGLGRESRGEPGNFGKSLKSLGESTGRGVLEGSGRLMVVVVRRGRVEGGGGQEGSAGDPWVSWLVLRSSGRWTEHNTPKVPGHAPG